MDADIFLSYAREDRPRIAALASFLGDAGYSVWWDHNVSGGAAFAAEIERALNEARAVIVAWSVRGVQSDWVLDEANVAKQAGKLVPIGLDATPPPLGFRQHQVVDFSSWDGESDTDAVQSLLQSIDRFTRSGSASNASSDRPVPISQAIAVLPLANFSGGEGQQFFVDGMHEALILELSKIGALKVVSRTSTRAFADTTSPLREIAAELGVGYLVVAAEGGYQAAMTRAAQTLVRQSQGSYVAPIQVALLFAMAGEFERCAEWIEKAFELGDPELPYLKELPRFPEAVLTLPRVQTVIEKLRYLTPEAPTSS